MSKPNILLTGCAGFIGANFVKKIASTSSDYNFHIVDALTYAGFYGSISDDIEFHEHLNFSEVDIRNREALREILSRKKYSAVIHFAAESHVDNSIKNPQVFVETNVMGTLNLLSEFYDSSPEGRFVHVSTDEVYGELSETAPAFTEKNNICPNSPYSASKASSDLLVRSYFETFNKDVLITRCSNNYGPFQNPEKLIPLMISNCFSGKSLPVYGEGKNIRDWIHVYDHCEGVWAVFKNGKSGEVYNLGGECEKRNIDIVKLIVEKTSSSEDLITYVEDRLGHDWRYAINNEKAKNELGWSPKINFDDGIHETINWYKENKEWIDKVKEYSNSRK